ncbi:hypothetical protein M501DRAFT_597703 [Patellaria atrata CBS 101060]|uniref:Uncharacterized protein n=1 Tax=Patellaria atrata CBS 101060 TaxID=1346257 RepID=A0A9P4S0Z3_9PEZI|nr:hypothetical protein M501DRAFT_597703 [Patellaria atrata CBS 101060]
MRVRELKEKKRRRRGRRMRRMIERRMCKMRVGRSKGLPYGTVSSLSRAKPRETRKQLGRITPKPSRSIANPVPVHPLRPFCLFYMSRTSYSKNFFNISATLYHKSLSRQKSRRKKKKIKSSQLRQLSSLPSRQDFALATDPLRKNPHLRAPLRKTGRCTTAPQHVDRRITRRNTSREYDAYAKFTWKRPIKLIFLYSFWVLGAPLRYYKGENVLKFIINSTETSSFFFFRKKKPFRNQAVTHLRN